MSEEEGGKLLVAGAVGRTGGREAPRAPRPYSNFFCSIRGLLNYSVTPMQRGPTAGRGCELDRLRLPARVMNGLVEALDASYFD
jgi:hypothetical protein